MARRAKPRAAGRAKPGGDRASRQARRSGRNDGARPASGSVGEAEEEAPAVSDPEDTLRQISTWSLAVLAAIAVGFVLYAGREIMLPVVAAFVVGIMLGPAARALEALRVPRPLAALLLVAGVTLLVVFVILLVVPRVSELASGLPGVVASLKEKLHVFDGLLGAWRGVASAVAESLRAATPLRFRRREFPGRHGRSPSCCRRSPDSCSFSVVLLLFIGAWPDLRRAMVMTFASRDLRLTVLKILNEIEFGLANYLLIVTLINVCVGALTGLICALTRTPNAVGFGRLAAALNFIPIIGPMATFVVLLLVGIVTAPTIALGLIPAGAFAALIVIEGQFVTPTIIGAPSGAQRARGPAVARLLDLALGADGSLPFLADPDGGADPQTAAVR